MELLITEQMADVCGTEVVVQLGLSGFPQGGDRKRPFSPYPMDSADSDPPSRRR